MGYRQSLAMRMGMYMVDNLDCPSNEFTGWIREAVHIQRGQERTMNHGMGQLKLSSTYIPILSDRKTADTP